MSASYPKRLALHWKDLAENRLPTEIRGVLDSAHRGRYDTAMETMSAFLRGRIDQAVEKCAAEIVLAFQGACNSHQKAKATKQIRTRRTRRNRNAGRR